MSVSAKRFKVPRKVGAIPAAALIEQDGPPSPMMELVAAVGRRPGRPRRESSEEETQVPAREPVIERPPESSQVPTEDAEGRRTKRSVQMGRRIRAERIARGFTQRDIANMLGLSTASAVTQWENGLTTPDRVNLDKLADKLGISAHWLKTGDFAEDRYRAATSMERELLDAFRELPVREQIDLFQKIDYKKLSIRR